MENETSILLAEDDLNLGQLLQTYLRSKGFKVSLAQNGKIAFEKFNRDEYDFCIFDIMCLRWMALLLPKRLEKLIKKFLFFFFLQKQ